MRAGAGVTSARKRGEAGEERDALVRAEGGVRHAGPAVRLRLDGVAAGPCWQLSHGHAGQPGGLPGRGVCVGAVVAQHRQPGVQEEGGGGVGRFIRRGHGRVGRAAGRQGGVDQPAGQVAEARKTTCLTGPRLARYVGADLVHLGQHGPAGPGWLNSIIVRFVDQPGREQPFDITANIVGGYLIGIAVEIVMHHSLLTPEWRLFIITGFLGGLTTFSTFSAEAVGLLSRQQYGWALGLIVTHLAGSLLMTMLGIMTVRAITT